MKTAVALALCSLVVFASASAAAPGPPRPAAQPCLDVLCPPQPPPLCEIDELHDCPGFGPPRCLPPLGCPGFPPCVPDEPGCGPCPGDLPGCPEFSPPSCDPVDDPGCDPCPGDPLHCPGFGPPRCVPPFACPEPPDDGH